MDLGARKMCKKTIKVEESVSISGWQTDTKAVLDGLPTYKMSLFPIPKSIEKRINRLRRSFLWQGNKEKATIW